VNANGTAVVQIGDTLWDSRRHPRLFESLSVDLATNEASEAVWTVFDPNFRMIDKYTRPGGVPMLVMRFWLGFGDDLGEPVFKGILASIERGDGSTTFRAYDMGLKMRLVKRTRYHNKRDDLAILARVAKDNQLLFEGPERPLRLEPHGAMLQDEQTDWEHAQERAREAGLVLFVRQDTLFAKYPAKVSAPKLTLRYRQDFLLLDQFDMRYRTPENQDGRPKQVVARGRGKGGKQLAGASDRSRRGVEEIVVKRDFTQRTHRHASRRAQAQKELERERAFSVTVRTLPPVIDLRLDVRETLKLEGLGQLFSGLYVADRVTHNYSEEELTTTFDLSRDVDEGILPTPLSPASGIGNF
jgi:phage protein D